MIDWEPQWYAYDDCPECEGRGIADMIDPEPWGVTNVMVYKGRDVCRCVYRKVIGVTFHYWSRITRRQDGDNLDDMPF